MSRNALVVGINTYEQLPPLQLAAKDAEAVAQLLQTYGECSVMRLPEVIDAGQPRVGLKTKVAVQDLKTALVQLFKPKGTNIPQTAIFFFSGHGIQDDNGIQEGFLSTSDADPSRGMYGLSLSWLRRLLQESPVRQKVIWLDCCNSGEFLNFKEADPGAATGTDRLFMTASREYQPAFESLDSPYSIFTQALLKGLNPERLESGVITNYALTDWVSNALKGEIQQPLFDNSGSEIVLTRANRATAPVVETRQVEKGICPYKGLSYFDNNEEDPKYFYGRRELTDQLLDKVRQGNFLAVVGASGSGKSSVLRAGLLHQLKLGRRLSGSDGWEIHLLVPGKHPLQSLALAFVESEATGTTRAKQLADAEELIGKGAVGLRQLVQASAASRVVLVVDQFEESFTLCPDSAERQRFFDCLLNGLAQTEKLCLILAMRADFFGKCLEQDYSGLAKQIQANMIAVTPMSREELRQAIVEPAKQTGLDVEPELVQEMLTDVEGSPGSLPLLQYTLTELWKNDQDGCLDLKTYSQLGGVMGTLQKRATAVYDQFPDEQKPVVKHLFLALTQLGEGTEDTRRRVLKPDLVNKQYSETLVDQVVQQLANANLIVTNELVEKGTTINRVAVVDIAHEALIRNWTLLRKWIEENRDKLRQKRKIEAAAEEWRSKGKPKGYFLQGRSLSDAEAFQKVNSGMLPLSSLAEEFIQKGLKQQRLNILKFGVVPAIGVLILTSIAGFYVMQQPQIAKDIQRQDTVSNYIDKVTELVADGKLAASGLNDESRLLVRVRTLNVLPELDGLRKGRVLSYLYEAGLIGKCVSNSVVGEKDFCQEEVIDLNGARFEAITFGRPIDLSGANLAGVFLTNADLPNTSLAKADLTRANLSAANLSRANLVSARMDYVRLRGANLEGSSLVKVTLRKADMRGANLKDVNSRNAILSGAFLEGANLEGANLEEVDLTSVELKGAKFTGALYNSATIFPQGFDPIAAGMKRQQ